MLAIAESSCATRIEFANVQYYGWAFANRDHLLPARAQLDASLAFIQQAQKRLEGKIRIEYVVPDYYAKYPKPCMGGWGRKLILITPTGEALPCHAAKIIPNLTFENVATCSLSEIWHSSPAFQKFRGQSWMQAPCKSCDRREQDHGGCRCQALLLAGDANATDPVCSLSPNRPAVDAILAKIDATPADSVVMPQHAAPTSSSTGTLVNPEERRACPPTAGPLRKTPWLYRPNPN